MDVIPYSFIIKFLFFYVFFLLLIHSIFLGGVFIQENPDLVMHQLNKLGIEAHRSSTQLTFIESDKSHNYQPEHPSIETVPYYPYEANYMMNNTVYLPVNKGVPFHVLDKICNAVKYITKKDCEKSFHSLQPKILSKL